ncbi:MAG: hypothetical protein ABIG69_17450 [Bacteroidota bacterium]
MKKYFVVLLFWMLLILSCKDSSVEPELIYDGITETNESGPEPTGNIDKDDWLEQYNYVVDPTLVPVSYSVYPAYPNPTKRFFTIRFVLPKSDSIVIVLDDKALNRKTTILSKNLNAGIHEVTIDLLYGNSEMKREEAIARVFLEIPTLKSFPKVHGDIKILKQ